MPKVKKYETKPVRVSKNSYDDLLFIKSQLETKTGELKSFDDVIAYLIGMWCKKYDKRRKKHG